MTAIRVLLTALLSTTALPLLWAQAQASPVWNISTTADDWDIVHRGNGEVGFDPVEGIRMKPAAAVRSDETHAVLLLAKKTLSSGLRNFRATITYVNEAQLRAGRPNDWEVFWLFFNYVPDGDDQKKTNYVIIKPRTGVEIGKAFAEVGQEFLLGDPRSTVQLGAVNTMTVTKIGQHVEVLLNGKKVASYASGMPPKELYDEPGAIGLYCEDAQVRVRSVAIEPFSDVLNEFPAPAADGVWSP